MIYTINSDQLTQLTAIKTRLIDIKQPFTPEDRQTQANLLDAVLHQISKSAQIDADPLRVNPEVIEES